jgi:hypothetical protein
MRISRGGLPFLFKEYRPHITSRPRDQSRLNTSDFFCGFFSSVFFESLFKMMIGG